MVTTFLQKEVIKLGEPKILCVRHALRMESIVKSKERWPFFVFLRFVPFTVLRLCFVRFPSRFIVECMILLGLKRSLLQ